MLRNPRYIGRKIWSKFIASHVDDDKTYLKWHLYFYLGYWPDLDNPKSYNEKLAWLKINYRDPLLTKLVDKYAVKAYVDEKLGKGHVFPCIGVWNTFDEIDFDKVPAEKFVLKTTHDTFGHPLIIDKSRLTPEMVDKARQKCEASLSRNLWKINREYPYKDVPRRIIAEPFMVDDSGTELKDYKFFCFNGDVKYCWAGCNFDPEWHFDFFDLDWYPLPCRYGYDNDPSAVKRPANLEEMVEVAKKLSEGLPHVRIDLYSIKGNIYLGEFTFFTWGGVGLFEPREYDYKFGEFIDLSKVKPIK